MSKALFCAEWRQETGHYLLSGYDDDGGGGDDDGDGVPFLWRAPAQSHASRVQGCW